MNGKRHCKQSKKTNDKLKKKFTTYIRDKKLPSLHYREPLKLERKNKTKTLRIEKVAKEKDSSQKKRKQKKRTIYDYEKMITLKEI